MGNLISRNNVDPEFVSSDESDEVEKKNDDFAMERPHFSLDIDATGVEQVQSRNNGINPITLCNIQDIENALDTYEKVSLIFLLSEKPEDCLNKISLYAWAKNEKEKSEKNWPFKFIEAVAIIKNFQVLKQYGYTRDFLINKLHPLAYYSTEHISKFKKVLYCICEELDEKNEKLFLENIRLDFKAKSLEFREYAHLELYLSYFLKIGYIEETNLANLKRILKKMDLELINDMFESININIAPSTKLQPIQNEKVKPFNKCISIDDQKNASVPVDDISYSTNDNVGSSRNTSGGNFVSSIENDNVYDITQGKVAFIIDQENFYNEVDEKYEHLLPPFTTEDVLHDRAGTEFDSSRLKTTLLKMGFIVDVKRNRTHLNMKSDLKKVIEAIDKNNCSCLFVSILSHGAEGVVYGCNSCYVEISEIIDVMSDAKLKEIPKVLVVQSCRGQNLQTVTKVDCNLETDGPRFFAKSELKDRDFLIFFSTVPGFASVRDKTSGTWFIQALCNQLDKVGNREHFADICTIVKNEIKKKKCSLKKNTESYMVPVMLTTLTKKLYLCR